MQSPFSNGCKLLALSSSSVHPSVCQVLTPALEGTKSLFKLSVQQSQGFAAIMALRKLACLNWANCRTRVCLSPWNSLLYPEPTGHTGQNGPFLLPSVCELSNSRTGEGLLKNAVQQQFLGLEYAVHAPLILENLQVNLSGHRCALLTDIFSPQKLLLDKITNLMMGEGLRKEFSQPEVNNQKGQEADIDQPQHRCHTGGCGGKELAF